MTLIIEPATLAQLPFVHRIMLDAYAEYAEVLPPASSSHLETMEDVIHAVGDGGAIIAWRNDLPVGSARYRRRGGALYVERVAVLPSYRRRGIASTMMCSLEQLARINFRTGHKSLRGIPATVGTAAPSLSAPARLDDTKAP
jgi:GNAT superfamily N-acetyltransferase